MKHMMMTLIAVSCLSAPIFVGAEDAKPAKDMAQYLTQLQLKLDHTAQRINQPTSNDSNVVGLRGSKQEPLSKQLYWKGKKGPVPVTPDEVKALRFAVEQARAGQKSEAINGLKSFQTKYPKSGLLSDAQETLALLETAPATSPIATPH